MKKKVRISDHSLVVKRGVPNAESGVRAPVVAL